MAARRKREADPMTQLAALVAAVERGGLARGYVLRGEERYFRDRAESKLRERAAADGHEVCVHDARDPDFELPRLLDDLSGGGLFAERRLVVLRGADGLLSKQGGRDEPLGRALLAFLAAPDDPGTVVLNVEKLRADHAVAKGVVAAGGTVLGSRRLWDSPPPWDPDPRNLELVRWLLGRAKALGVKLDAGQAVYVAAATGNDLYALEGQLERLRGAPPEELRRIVGWEAEGSPFQLAEHLVAGRRGRALGGVEALFRGGFRERDGSRLRDAPGLVAILTASILRLVRQGLTGALALERGASLDEAADEAGVPRTKFARGPFEERVRARPASEWRAMLGDVTDLERRTKSGATVDANDFTLLALRWSSAEGGRRALASRPRGRV